MTPELRREARKLLPNESLSDDECNLFLQEPAFRRLCELLACDFLPRGEGATEIFLRTMPDVLLDYLLWPALDLVDVPNAVPSVAAALAMVENPGKDPDEGIPELAANLAKRVVAEAERRYGIPQWPVAIVV